MPLEGFKKMIDTIEALKQDGQPFENLHSVIFAGSASAENPELQTNAKDDVIWAVKETLAYMREKFPTQGIYYALGSKDVFPLH